MWYLLVLLVVEDAFVPVLNLHSRGRGQ